MRKRGTSAWKRVLWRAGLLPGLIAAGIALVFLGGSGVFSTYQSDRPECQVYDLQPGPGFEVYVPAGCEAIGWLPLILWALAAFVVVALIGLAAQALWPGWNDKT